MAASAPRWAPAWPSAASPTPADEIAVVANGRGSMPVFADSLTAEQIAAVVEYTRTGLG